MNKLYIFCGLPFSGKSTLTKELARRFGFTRIDLDEVKFDLFGKDITDVEIDQSGWDRIYQEMYQRIKIALKNGETVIHDTGNFTRYERGLVRQIADRLHIPTTTVYVDTSKEICLERLRQNKQSNNRFQVSEEEFMSAAAEMEIPGDDENTLVYHYMDSIDSWIPKFIR